MRRYLKFLLSTFTNLLPKFLLFVLTKVFSGKLHIFLAQKLMDGECQVFPTLDGIRQDHIGRYKFACQYVSKGDKVLDIASGVGYGSYILSEETDAESIVAVDKNINAVKYGKRYYKSPKIKFIKGNCLSLLPKNYFDVIISFETIEHIEDDELFIRSLYVSLKQGGYLILSSPNQHRRLYSSKKFPFHVRHYTPDDIIKLTRKCGFTTESAFSQPSTKSAEVVSGMEGLTIILVLKKSV